MTESVSVFTGLKSAAAAGFLLLPHSDASPEPDVVGVVVSEPDLSLLLQAESPAASATAIPRVTSLRIKLLPFRGDASRYVRSMPRVRSGSPFVVGSITI